jgi:hypothetical protein
MTVIDFKSRCTHRWGTQGRPEGNAGKAHLGEVVSFPGPPAHRNRLTPLDIQQASAWVVGNAGKRCQIKVYANPTDEEIGDFISIYHMRQHWATWGAARRDRVVLVWEAVTGVDIGTYRTMKAALRAIHCA